MTRVTKLGLWIGLLCIVTACSNTTNIQRRYVDGRDECRENAEIWVERHLDARAQTFDQKDLNAQLATVFSDCMFTKGWTVATPPREGQPGEVEDVGLEAPGTSLPAARKASLPAAPANQPAAAAAPSRRQQPGYSDLDYQ